jgi:tetratricopeptide (TPR) repeat protein
LGDEAAAQLIRAERGTRSVPPQLVRTISARAAGNPLYLRELVRALGPDDDVETLPGSLDALLTARLDQLPPADRHLVCRAAVLGQRFATDLLPVVLDEGSAPVTPSVLARIRDFVGPVPGARLGFGHALIRDAAYELLPYRTRRMLHGRVAEHLTASGSADPGVLSYHFFAAQQWSEAWQTARSAADAALASHAPVEAAELLDRALESGRHVEDISAATLLATGLELSRAYERSSRYDAAERTYRRLGQWATDPLDRARVKVQLAWLAERRSHIALAVRRAHAAAVLLEAPGIAPEARDICLAEARTIEGMGLELAGNHRGAADALNDAVRLARQHGADRTEAQAASILDWALAMSGQLDRPTNLYRALDLYRSLGDVPGEAACLTNLGALAYLDGRWTEAVDYYRQGQSAHARSGDETSAALGAANTGEVLSDQGHWDDAVAVLTEALGVWRATGHEHGVAYALGLLGRANARAHRFDEALAGLEEARDRHLAVGAKGDAAQVWLWLAEAHCLRGSADVVDETLSAGADDGSVTARRIRATALGLQSASSGVDALIAARIAAAAEDEVYETVVIDHTLAAFDLEGATDHVLASQPHAQQLGVQRVALPVSLT